MHPEIKQYIDGQPERVRDILNRFYALIAELSPEAEPCINYGIPTFKLKGKNLVHFAGFKQHVGFYPSPSAIQHFTQELSDYETSKGTVKFPLDAPIPYDLVDTMARFRIRETTQA